MNLFDTTKYTIQYKRILAKHFKTLFFWKHSQK